MFHQKCSIKNKVVRGIAILLSSEYLTHLNTILKRKKDGQILGKEPKKKEEVKSREKVFYLNDGEQRMNLFSNPFHLIILE